MKLTISFYPLIPKYLEFLDVKNQGTFTVFIFDLCKFCHFLRTTRHSLLRMTIKLLSTGIFLLYYFLVAALLKLLTSKSPEFVNFPLVHIFLFVKINSKRIGNPQILLLSYYLIIIGIFEKVVHWNSGWLQAKIWWLGGSFKNYMECGYLEFFEKLSI